MHCRIMVLAGMLIAACGLVSPAGAGHLLVPMDGEQSNHLRAYGLTYWCLSAPRVYPCEWLLNYRGGSFLIPDGEYVRARAAELNVRFEPVDEHLRARIYRLMDGGNMERIHLARAPRMAVYVAPTTDPWDDAVRLALEYAEIEYDVVWDHEVLAGKLADYDWLHLHHEDFTGQFGKFFVSFAAEPWYRRQVDTSRQAAVQLGFPSVGALKQAVAAAIDAWTAGGGLLFAMCSAPDSLDIALAAQGLDIVPPEIGGMPADPRAQEKLDYSRTLAFTGFRLFSDPYQPGVSDINIAPPSPEPTGETFKLFEFSAREDPIASMLVQNHVSAVPDFLGLTTAFRGSLLKPHVVVLGDFPGQDKVKYIHAAHGDGTFTFLGGHDPEDYAHFVGEPPTDLSKHPNSPGYRLILNNVLFPAAKVRERKT